MITYESYSLLTQKSTFFIMIIEKKHLLKLYFFENRTSINDLSMFSKIYKEKLVLNIFIF